MTMNNSGLNVMILSCGTRNKLVKYFKKTLAGQGLVIATDCSKLAPALYEADKHYIVPRIDSDGYLDVVLDICRSNRIKAVLSLIDPELSLLAKYKDVFTDIGVTPIISDHEAVELCFDKYRMANFLAENGFNTARSYISKAEFYADVLGGNISYPVFVKPIKGSASININKVDSEEEIEALFKKHENLMVQEFMNGTELGADVYVDLISGDTVSIFLKEKILMRAGETDKSVSIKDDRLFGIITDFVKKANLRGIIDMDIFKVEDEFYISEVNPRFGGGYPHAHECGVNMVDMLLNNVRGKENTAQIGQYEAGIYMMKYSDVLLKRLKVE